MKPKGFFPILFFKYKQYGFFRFFKFSFLELYRIYLRNFHFSFSEFKEDMVIDRYLDKNKPLTYIDVGSNHPVKFSNTYLFYLRGGKGVHIEPNSQFLPLYKKYRPKDKFLNYGLSDHLSFLTFYEMFPDVGSSFSFDNMKEEIKKGSILVSKKKIKVITLKEVFEKILKVNYVDLISIDTEKFDLKVLKGNDWKRYRSKIICIEKFNQRIYPFLNKAGYRQVYENANNSIFLSKT